MNLIHLLTSYKPLLTISNHHFFPLVQALHRAGPPAPCHAVCSAAPGGALVPCLRGRVGPPRHPTQGGEVQSRVSFAAARRKGWVVELGMVCYYGQVMMVGYDGWLGDGGWWLDEWLVDLWLIYLGFMGWLGDGGSTIYWLIGWGWLIDWLVEWWNGWLIGGLNDCLIRCLGGWLFCWLMVLVVTIAIDSFVGWLLGGC